MKNILLTTVIMVFIGSSYVLAQTPPFVWNTFNQNGVSLEFHVVAIDAQTKGAVTSATQQILLGIEWTNHSPFGITYDLTADYYNNVQLILSNGSFESNGTVYSYQTEQKGSVGAFSKSYFPLNMSQPITVTNLLKDTIRVNLVVAVNVTEQNPTASDVPVRFLSNVSDIIYTPSNNDLVPTILNNVNNIGTTPVPVVLTASEYGADHFAYFPLNPDVVKLACQTVGKKQSANPLSQSAYSSTAIKTVVYDNDAGQIAVGTCNAVTSSYGKPIKNPTSCEVSTPEGNLVFSAFANSIVCQ